MIQAHIVVLLWPWSWEIVIDQHRLEKRLKCTTCKVKDIGSISPLLFTIQKLQWFLILYKKFSLCLAFNDFPATTLKKFCFLVLPILKSLLQSNPIRLFSPSYVCVTDYGVPSIWTNLISSCTNCNHPQNCS